MKKSIIMLACGMLMASSAIAQDSKALYGEAQKAYNGYFLKAQGGNLDDEAAMCLQTSYDLYTQALACDTIFETNKDGSPKLDKKTGKPKFKTKVSGDIVKAYETMIAQNDFLIAGEYYRGKEDYHNAALAYGRNAALLQSKYAKNVPDSVLSETLFLQGFANYFDKDYKNCFINMVKAKELGYTANGIDQFIDDAPNQIIQKFVNESNYAGANEALDHMLAEVPTNANLYTLKARVQEFEKGFEAAIPAYEAALSRDPNNAFAYYCMGVGYTDIVNNAIMNSKAITDAALAKEIAPLLGNPIKYLSKAVELNNNISPEMLEDAQKKLNILNQYNALVQ